MCRSISIQFQVKLRPISDIFWSILVYKTEEKLSYPFQSIFKLMLHKSNNILCTHKQIVVYKWRSLIARLNVFFTLITLKCLLVAPILKLYQFRKHLKKNALKVILEKPKLCILLPPFCYIPWVTANYFRSAVTKLNNDLESFPKYNFQSSQNIFHEPKRGGGKNLQRVL